MRVYLDNCCYNRPFDNQSQTTVKLETIAKLAVQLQMATKQVEFVWSGMLDYETSFNPDPRRRAAVQRWRDWATVFVATTDEILGRARDFEAQGLKPKDAIHVAAAESAGCDCFLTTDRGIIKKLGRVGSMRIMNPTEYLMEEHDATD